MQKPHYRGKRKRDGSVVRFWDGKAWSDLDPRYDLRKHSPAGFEWGYSGSGPAQLALALSCHALESDDWGEKLYQTVKQLHVAHMLAEEWIIPQANFRTCLELLRITYRLEHPYDAPCVRGGPARGVDRVLTQGERMRFRKRISFQEKTREAINNDIYNRWGPGWSVRQREEALTGTSCVTSPTPWH